MVIGAFPAAKLGALLLKQISKPIANYIISQAKSSPIFRTYVCMPPAQFYNWCEVKTKMWILNLGKPVNIPVLNEQMAIELGANLLGEGIIFIVAAMLLLSEYSRSVRKETAKEAAKKEEMTSLTNDLREMFMQVEEQRVQIRELLRIVTELDSQAVKKLDGGSKGDQGKDPKDTPPPPSSPSAVSNNFVLSIKPIECAYTPVTYKDNFVDNSTSLLLKAVEIVENDYFINSNQKRELGILAVALNHFYKDVYRVPINMC